MKKFISGLVLMSVLGFPGLSFASTASLDYLGQQYARVNLNIRMAPVVGDNLLGHVDKGGSVNVVGVVGNWCKIQYKFSNAYVYCPDLQANGNSVVMAADVSVKMHSVDANSPAVKAFSDTNSWLYNDDNLGINLINGSYFSAEEKATGYWDKAAKLADFYFTWPFSGDKKCSLIFSSPAKAHEVYYSTCFVGSVEGVGAPKDMDKPLVGYELPKLPFKQFIADILADKTLMVRLDDYFKNSQNLEVLYRLYSLKGTLEWESKLIDGKTGMFMIISSDATKETSNLKIETGRFN